MIKNGRNEEIAVVTRNSYGALVLNSANAMFIDIDFPQQGWFPNFLGTIRRFLGNRLPSQERSHIAGIEEWAHGHPDVGLRVYRTFRGLRGLITSALFDPTQESALDILRELESDPLYVNLCRSQECFRARLSPKPWRFGAPRPPSTYPWENSEDEHFYRQWEAKYSLAASKYTVCRFVKHIGSREIHPQVETILSLHDQHACSGHPLKLA